MTRIPFNGPLLSAMAPLLDVLVSLRTAARILVVRCSATRSSIVTAAPGRKCSRCNRGLQIRDTAARRLWHRVYRKQRGLTMKMYLVTFVLAMSALSTLSANAQERGREHE